MRWLERRWMTWIIGLLVEPRSAITRKRIRNLAIGSMVSNIARKRRLQKFVSKLSGSLKVHTNFRLQMDHDHQELLHAHRSKRIPCPADVNESLDRCRFCVHSVRFSLQGKEVIVPGPGLSLTLERGRRRGGSHQSERSYL